MDDTKTWQNMAYQLISFGIVGHSLVISFHIVCYVSSLYLFSFFDTSFDDKNLIIIPEESPPIRNELWIHPMLHLGSNFAGGGSLNIADNNVLRLSKYC